jgi:hypothetical protein
MKKYLIFIIIVLVAAGVVFLLWHPRSVQDGVPQQNEITGQNPKAGVGLIDASNGAAGLLHQTNSITEA